MSDHSHGDAHSKPSGSLKTLVFAFLLPVLIIGVLVSNFVGMHQGSANGAPSAQATAKRIQKVGSVELGGSGGGGGGAKSGEDVYKGQCASCHGSGALGAPKFGDAGAWGPRIKGGLDALLTSALKGKGNMAPQGGGQFSDQDIARAIVYMANNAGGKLAEPAAGK